MSPQSKSRRAEATEATREALVEAARELFAERGYSAVPTEEIVRRARVSRGALYHHFTDKRDVFRAVFEQVELELVTVFGAALSGGDDLWADLSACVEAFLDACARDDTVQRIVFLEAPSVLGWSAWRELDAQYGLGIVIGALDALMERGYLERRPVRPLAHMLLGALNEGALLVAHADDPAAQRAEVTDTFTYLLERLRVRSA
ncbi:helix-turn-helix domain-containing protein [Streptomyces sp. NPDC047108]|uniref:TetR/AcrR family transcriptional regulator n=1 Tax=Streptomyces sp. NPDC047108 TaxID=3155025 RepID=UPI0034017744